MKKITTKWLIDVGFKNIISYELHIKDDKYIIVSWNDVNKWYCFFKNTNIPIYDPITKTTSKGSPPDIVTLMNDLIYQKELIKIVDVLSKGKIKLYTQKKLRKEKLKQIENDGNR